MNDRRFSLQPSSPVTPLTNLKITGSITRSSNTLAIRYALLGKLTTLMIPSPADIPVRKNNLWEETCFELFLAIKNSPGYWEFNLSPAGHWNVYRFTAYRQGMQEEEGFISLPISVKREPGALRLALELQLNEIVQADQLLEVGISGVIKKKDGALTYWALSHPGPQADFHRRDSFIIEL